MNSFAGLFLGCHVGLDEEGKLHQYVIYKQKQKGLKITKLDDPKGKNTDIENYTPSTSITVHLSLPNSRGCDSLNDREPEYLDPYAPQHMPGNSFPDTRRRL